ncbi:unnamed protein product [Hermetia illucens]|uniref:Uncharacterized protein n=1 Tax=Hermetia illucens TaxID=343691 RepID=A0A7R8UPY1_HERIL|nr:uncharacterized protein LOC119653243 [Hermetia illucens]CAD7084804.1 unnamed protein product [Hermetia illucens]
MFIRTVYLTILFQFTFAEESKQPDLSDQLAIKCGPVGCQSDGEILCGKLADNFRIFEDDCARRAHYCETGENYAKVPLERCPPEAYSYDCLEDEDLFCATADDENYAVFSNSCEYGRFLAVLRRVYWTVPLKYCVGLPNMPITACTKIGGLSAGKVCASNGEKHKIFDNLFSLNQEKCFSDGNWRKVSMIYCSE